MENHFNGITEKMIQGAKSLNEKRELAKKLGIEITDDNVLIPDALFKIFKPRVFGKLIGGLFLVVVGDLAYKVLAKKVIEKYPKYEGHTNKILFVIKHADLFLNPSLLKIGMFAAGNAKDFKKGFDAGYGRVSKFGKYLIAEIKTRIGGKVKPVDNSNNSKNNEK